MRRSIWFAAVVLCAAPSFAAPQGNVVTLERGADKNSSAAYWTPERLAAAKPYVLAPTIAADGVDAAAVDEASATEEGVSVPGAPPSRRPGKNLRQQILDPAAVEAFADAAEDAVEGENVGGQAAHFTSSRLIPLSADQTYPYTTVGKLFFTKQGVGDFICSASVIRQRLILTAGHCVHKGSGGTGGFFTNFLFVPAYRDGVAPFGTWDWAYVVTTSTWSTGNAVFPNAQDFAIIEPEDFNGFRIGASFTGYLGYVTGKLNPNHATLLGYPKNLDGGLKMHQVTAGSKGSFGNNSVIYGADMTGGASGGPWVQNFGAAATGQTLGTNKTLNQVIGVTSFGPVNTSLLFLGSSIPDSRFVSLINTACAHRAGNCS